MINIDELIRGAFAKLKVDNSDTNKFYLNTLKLIKAKFLEFKTSKDGVKKLITLEDGTKEIGDADKITLLNKMVKELNDGAEQMSDAKPELADEYYKQAAIIVEFIPKAATTDEIKEYVRDYVVDNGFVTVDNTRGMMPKSEIGKCVKYVKEKLPNADGKTVSQVVMAFIQ